MDEKTLTDIADLAGRLMPVRDIALILDIPFDEFRAAMKDPKSAIFRAYQTGYLKTKAEIQLSIVNHAKVGSSPAQALASSFMTQLKMDESDDWR